MSDSEMYRIHCDKCDMHTGKMHRPTAVKGAGSHTVATGHKVRAEEVDDE